MASNKLSIAKRFSGKSINHFVGERKKRLAHAQINPSISVITLFESLQIIHINFLYFDFGAIWKMQRLLTVYLKRVWEKLWVLFLFFNSNPFTEFLAYSCMFIYYCNSHCCFCLCLRCMWECIGSKMETELYLIALPSAYLLYLLISHTLTHPVTSIDFRLLSIRWCL